MYNPWAVLGTHRQASDEEVRSAYLAKMKMIHPDVADDVGDAAEVNEAYRVLKNSTLRSELITILITWNKACSTCRGAGATFKQKGFTNREAISCRTCGGSGFLAKRKK